MQDNMLHKKCLWDHLYTGTMFQHWVEAMDHLFFRAEALRHTETPPQSPYQWNGNKASTLPTKRQLPFLTFFCWTGHPKGCRRLKCNEKLTLWMSNFWFFCQRTLGSRVMDGFLGSTSFGNASKLGIHPGMMPWAAHTKNKNNIWWLELRGCYFKKSHKERCHLWSVFAGVASSFKGIMAGV